MLGYSGLREGVKMRAFSGLIRFFSGAGLLLLFSGCALVFPENSRKHSLYIDLNEYPLYVKDGFNPASAAVPDLSGGSWLVKMPGERFKAAKIESLGLPNMPRRPFLSLFGESPREYTMVIPFTVSPEQFEKISGKEFFQPGIFLAALGDNWEIFLNGALIKSEIHLDGEGQISSGRSWRYISFPLDRSLFVRGTNTLAFRIVGAPHSDVTGLWYKEPYYIGEYETIRKDHGEALEMAICGIYFFVGIYHFLVFLNQPKDRYNLYYCFFSSFLGIFLLMRSSAIYDFIPNTNITFRIEYICVYMMVPMLAAFLEHLRLGKTIRITKVCGGISLLFALTQGIFSGSLGDDILAIWWEFALFEIAYILGYDILYPFCRDFNVRRQAAGRHSLPALLVMSFTGTPLGNIIIATVIMCLTASVDVFKGIRNQYGIINFSRIGFFVFTITTTVVLARRFGSLFRRIDEVNSLLERSNLNLEDTVRKRTQELERQTHLAKSASLAKSDFLARMSHEIRTPLNVILGLSEVELQDKLPDRTRLNLDKIYRSGSHLLEIVNDILDISKIESGNFEIHPAEYEFSAMISDTIHLNITRIGIKPIEFRLEIDQTIPSKLYGDELRMKQILNNLLSNAFKYTEEGDVRLELGWERQGDEARIDLAVQDTGRGIRTEDLERLFSDYIQLDATANRRIEGTGLGLSITRGLVETMGGTISVESEYGKGSVFRVRLPQGIVDEKPIGGEQAENLQNFHFSEDRNRSRGNTLIRSYMPYGKVLVVDDLPTNLDVMKGLLMPYGLRLDMASSGPEAVDAVRRENPRYDLIFMAHMMPEMDGIEATRIIRNEIGSPYAQQVAVIALTANAIAGNREMFLNSGFNDFISKPVDIKRLDMVLNYWVRDKQSQAILEEAERQSRDLPEREDIAGDGKPDAEGKRLLARPVEGIDFVKALELYGNSGAAYLPILRSFVANTPLLLEKMDLHLESAPDYAIEAHGLKGTSNAIGAEEEAALARELELAAKEGNLDLVRSRHGDLMRKIRLLLDRLTTFLAEWDADRAMEEKKKRTEPERELLIRLSGAAVEFNSNVVEEVLGELEQYQYETGAELIGQLRERAEAFDYDGIQRHLEEFLGITNEKPGE
jgi:signal transduction histidine kinase/DNA-binding NarL/FixJ family response regulator/HPt (histidine-containing phosphotransfer) domain-containing protein